MKNLIYLFVLLFFTTILFAQSEEEEEQFPATELNIQVQNVPDGIILFQMIPIGANWAISTGCNFNTYNDNTTYSSTLTTGSSGYVDCFDNGYNYRYYNEGNNRIVGGCAQQNAGLNPIRNGFYRLNVFEIVEDDTLLKTYIYLDWRLTGFPMAICDNTCSNNDWTLRYDGNDEKLWFWNEGGIDINRQDPEEELVESSILFFREWNCSNTNFSPFWGNGLVLIPRKNSSTDIYEPYIIWGPHKTFEPTGYKIYYREGGTGNFSLLQTVSASTYEYRHVGLAVGSGILYEYKVQAYNNQSSSDFTNTVSINTDGFYKSNPEVLNNTVVKEYELGQNFPNPFNPTTTIGYKIMNEGFVSIKIYDILGNEVKTLVNEIKSPGAYNVNWEGDNNLGEKLTSGVYFYHMQAGNYSSSKKMIIQK